MKYIEFQPVIVKLANQSLKPTGSAVDSITKKAWAWAGQRPAA